MSDRCRNKRRRYGVKFNIIGRHREPQKWLFLSYFIFGMAQHRAKIFCPDAYQNTGSSITKGYNTPVFGLGINVAVTKNVHLNLQWQRHMGGVKSWGNIENIIPQGRLAMGSPQSRSGNTMILFGVTCVTNFNGKR